MFERFTDRARKVMALANQEAQRFNHEYIGTEHILLGLVKEGSGVGANILKNLRVTREKIYATCADQLKHGPTTQPMGKLPQTPRAKALVAYAVEEANALGHNYVGTEHLLLGFLRTEEAKAPTDQRIDLGVTTQQVRREVLNLLTIADDKPDQVFSITIAPHSPRTIDIPLIGGSARLELCWPMSAANFDLIIAYLNVCKPALVAPAPEAP